MPALLLKPLAQFILSPSTLCRVVLLMSAEKRRSLAKQYPVKVVQKLGNLGYLFKIRAWESCAA